VVRHIHDVRNLLSALGVLYRTCMEDVGERGTVGPRDREGEREIALANEGACPDPDISQKGRGARWSHRICRASWWAFGTG
jgi:hypothetical protein